MTVEGVDAIVLSGGSAFGLDAAGGVMARELSQARKLFEKGMEHLHRREMEPAALQALLAGLAERGVLGREASTAGRGKSRFA